ncbi:immunity 52 family protein [Janthinobacterium sp. NKUCC08_JDC]|uniref:immunity 52 family protein n=1 Tax=Janthinobacterium sp. NKUCC08_JDC TaxID=2842122 RepID=UPI001C5BE2C3|nr:immunity 52 family protein [Janthinobacterium sp. NKUCC08_JDC]MBW3499916.1 immunity 52 family protein [Janthinobacterium sp. NKUCC08_JDC]
MKRPYEFTAIFRHAGALDVKTMLGELQGLVPELLACSPILNGWFLKGNKKAEALLYEVFDQDGPTTAAIAALTESLKHDVDPRIVSMWNGRDGSEGASVQYVGRLMPETSMMVLRAKPGAFAKDWQLVKELVLKSVAVWRPTVVTVESAGYFDKKVFKDRPGIGWMLYLPRVLNVQQVPEARALVPVLGADNQQIGTIIVSVIDAPFSEENLEHVKIANAIEIRLVDQDLLPRYEDL